MKAVCSSAHWRSDGAGIQFVAIAMVVLAVLGVVFGVILFSSFSREEWGEEDRLASVRAGCAVLLILFVALVGVWVAWRYQRSAASLRRVGGGRPSAWLLAATGPVASARPTSKTLTSRPPFVR